MLGVLVIFFDTNLAASRKVLQTLVTSYTKVANDLEEQKTQDLGLAEMGVNIFWYIANDPKIYFTKVAAVVARKYT